MSRPLPHSVDVVVVGGGPAGATAAWDLACSGHQVLLLERGARIKPCGGAVPPRLLEEFAVPEALLVARIDSARISAPSHRHVDMPIDGGYVGMVYRETFDAWLRERAAAAGVQCVKAEFGEIARDGAGNPLVRFAPLEAGGRGATHEVRTAWSSEPMGRARRWRGSASPVPRRMRYVAAYHEIVAAPAGAARDYAATRCDVYYEGGAVAGLLRLGVPARGACQRRSRHRTQGLFAAPGRARRCASARAWARRRRCAAKARRYR